MAITIAKDAQTFTLKFGGGLDARAGEINASPLECVDGQNFDLDFDLYEFRKRPSFSLVATATNGSPIRGFIQLVKADNTRSVLVQAGDTVYEWDGTSTGFTSVATVSPNSKLRGTIEANSVKDSKVFVTDLNLLTPLKTWDGTTFTSHVHNLTGTLYAKYAIMAAERLILANITNQTTNYPHLLVASKQEDPATLTVANKPSSSLGVSDAFYIPMPNLHPAVGLLEAFGKVIIPTMGANFYQLTGTDSQDSALGNLDPGLGASGEEGVAFVGNDVLYSKQGGIDTLVGTDRFGNVSVDDVSRWIYPLVKDIDSFTLAYNSRLKKLYCIPVGGGKAYVLHKSFLDDRTRRQNTGTSFAEAIVGKTETANISPWSVYTTSHDFNFTPVTVMRMYRPSDGLEFVYMGDIDGNIYQMDSDSGADPSSTSITAERLSRVFELPPGRVFDVNGWIRSRQIFAGTVTLTFEYGGYQLFDRSVTVTLDAASNAPVFGGTVYFGGSYYFNSTFNGGRLQKKPYNVAGFSDQFQIRVSITGTSDFFIDEIGVNLKSAAP